MFTLWHVQHVNQIEHVLHNCKILAASYNRSKSYTVPSWRQLYRVKGEQFTLMCLSIGTPKTFNFPFVPNGKLMDFRCSNS